MQLILFYNNKIKKIQCFKYIFNICNIFIKIHLPYPIKNTIKIVSYLNSRSMRALRMRKPSPGYQ